MKFADNRNAFSLMMLVSFWIFFGCLTTTAMAVDRSKFRTCDQTSFCRRHRHAKHKHMFEYQLLKDSVHFHKKESEQESEKDEVSKAQAQAQAEAEEEKDGVWKSLSRKLLGGDNNKASSKKERQGGDVYVAGPTPTLTGLLQNKVNTADDVKELLNLTVTCLQKGMIRIRATELYGTPGTPYEQARVTYDELVLETNQLHPSGHALWIPNLKDNNNNINPAIASLVAEKNVENHMALVYGDVEDATNNMVLLLQLDPFVVSLYRESELLTHKSPLVTMGAEQMIHFEQRRYQKPEEQKEADEKAKDAEDKQQENEKPKEEKEIVGYWEDGLAIYADGTREEKKKTTEDDESASHRQLTEAELDQEGLWEEKFAEHKDSKPYGPMSVGMDIAFPNSQHLFGIPEHASSTVLKTTTTDDNEDDENNKPHYKEPYRLYNLDVFEYELDETMALYGHVPLVVSQSIATGTVGVFWFNPTETFVEVKQQPPKAEPNKKMMTTHWMSESGVLDIFLLPGPSPPALYRQYADLTGVTPVPPMFSLGYHQCRWNYKDEKDVFMVHGKFEELDYPYDVLWLDIEHTDGKRYFTWDKHMFPDPTNMLETLAATGRRMVTIIDPHIKRDDQYYIHKEATSKGLYVKDKDGSKDYDGWCWPGSSSYLDFTAEHVRNWWAEQFGYNKYKGSTPTLFTWNDMNEPSVFNGPEVSMQKDLRNLNGEEHREWHNLYGMLFHRATGEGQIKRNNNHNVRPFVLSRSFFAGSQKYGAIWTGDNKAEWSHLEVASPMLLSLNIAALSFVGADVGGFFGNPDAELFTRWMQAGAYQPFFRGHAHHDSKRREPWMYDDDTLYRLRRAAMARYALLPFWYTVFYYAETTGMPVMRTMWMQYPKTEELFATDDQYLIGADLLVKPITKAGVTFTNVLFPTDDLWYDAHSLKLVSSATTKPAGVESKTVPADIDAIPVFQRGGSVIGRKLRLRRSTVQMKTDPYTLYIALNEEQAATGSLYMDDEETFSYSRNNEYALATFSAAKDGADNIVIRNTVQVGAGWADFIHDLANDRAIERIVIMLGSFKEKTKPTAVTAVKGSGHGESATLGFTYTEENNVITIHRTGLSAVVEGEILISY